MPTARVPLWYLTMVPILNLWGISPASPIASDNQYGSLSRPG